MQNQNQKLLPTNFEKVMNNDRFEVWIDKSVVKNGVYPGFRVDLKLSKVEPVSVIADPKTKFRVIGLNGHNFYSNSKIR